MTFVCDTRADSYSQFFIFQHIIKILTRILRGRVHSWFRSLIETAQATDHAEKTGQIPTDRLLPDHPVALTADSIALIARATAVASVCQPHTDTRMQRRPRHVVQVNMASPDA